MTFPLQTKVVNDATEKSGCVNKAAEERKFASFTKDLFDSLLLFEHFALEMLENFCKYWKGGLEVHCYNSRLQKLPISGE